MLPPWHGPQHLDQNPSQSTYPIARTHEQAYLPRPRPPWHSLPPLEAALTLSSAAFPVDPASTESHPYQLASPFLSNLIKPATPHFSWGSLVRADGTASPLLARLLDAIFALVDAHMPPFHAGALPPSNVLVLYTALGYPPPANPARWCRRLAVAGGGPRPRAVQNDLLALYYRVLGLAHASVPGAAGPALTRDGFRRALLADARAEPAALHVRLDQFLGNNAYRLLDGETGAPFPATRIPREAFPASGDGEVLRARRERMVVLEVEIGRYFARLRAGRGAALSVV